MIKGQLWLPLCFWIFLWKYGPPCVILGRNYDKLVFIALFRW